MSTVQQRMTADRFYEWLARPENQEKCFELERGEPVERPSPGIPHGMICSLMAHFLWQYVFETRRGYVCSNDSGLLVEEYPDTIRGPDVMLFDNGNDAENLSRRYSREVPKVLVEVLSPHDRVGATNLRISQYLSRGVPLIWLVDPEIRTVTVYRPDQSHRVLEENETLACEEVLPGFSRKVAELFILPGQEPTK